MPFLALPGSTVLIQRVVGLHLFEAGRANEEPLLRFVNANSVKSVVGLFTRSQALVRMRFIGI